MLIYNLFPTLAGSFDEWTPHLERAADLGFDWVFVNPVQRPGRSGSLYSVADYFAFNPALLRPGKDPEAQVRAMLDQAHALGLKVMVDLVINHCAADSALAKEHPQWFLMENGQPAHPFCMEDGRKVVWEDLIQFDHRNSADRDGLFRYGLKICAWLLDLGFDGFRCDAAYQLPFDTWQRLIRETRAAHPGAVFTAETLGCTADQTRETGRAGFNAVFNSSKYWNYHDHWLLEQYNLIRETVSSISFPESHDTPRLAAEFNGHIDAAKQRYTFAALFSAHVMMPIGYEFGFRHKPDVVHATPADWEEPSYDLRDFIRGVNAIKRAHDVFQEDAPTQVLGYGNPNILLMWKAAQKGQGEALIILNKDLGRHQDFYVDDCRHLIQSGAALTDVSPEFPLDCIPQPFHYALRPGQVITLVTRR